jgi:hypothetical protein
VQGGGRAGELDYVGFYDKPLLKFGRMLKTYLDFSPAGFCSFLMAIPLWMRQKPRLSREIRREHKDEYRLRIMLTEHHELHAASAFFPSSISASPKRGRIGSHFLIREKKIRGSDIAAFLRNLLRHVQRDVIVTWATLVFTAADHQEAFAVGFKACTSRTCALRPGSRFCRSHIEPRRSHPRQRPARLQAQIPQGPGWRCRLVFSSPAALSGFVCESDPRHFFPDAEF